MSAPSAPTHPPNSLPLIDISPFHAGSSADPSAKSATAAALSHALSTTGFFYLTSHGVPAALQSSVLAHAREFFLTSTAAAKAAIARRDPGQGGDGARGYQELRSNTTGGRRDVHEAIDFFREWDAGGETRFDAAQPAKGWKLLRGPNLYPPAPAGLRGAVEEYAREMLALGATVLRALAWAAGYADDEDVFLRHARRSFWVFRLIGYPPLRPGAGAADADDAGGLSCGEHTDYGCVTLLLADETRGALQVQLADGRWVDADPVPGAYVVNIGDMMERWTNGAWRSTRHRVVHTAPNGGGEGGYRVSAPFFYEPDWDAKVAPLGKFVERAGGEKKWGEKVYGEHLTEKVRHNFHTGDN